MPWPDTMPVFTPDDILIDEENYSNSKGQRTLVGWLKELFLFSKMDKNHIWIDIEDRKIFNSVIEKIRREGIIKGSLHEYEDIATAKQQCVALNLLRKKLGYTEIVDE
jgi:hypothetical protein